LIMAVPDLNDQPMSRNQAYKKLSEELA
jgi:hypothetical protein